nr:MAG TPA: hypothetical protein [Caudoviricetes sp.]
MIVHPAPSSVPCIPNYRTFVLFVKWESPEKCPFNGTLSEV